MTAWELAEQLVKGPDFPVLHEITMPECLVGLKNNAFSTSVDRIAVEKGFVVLR